MKPVKTWILIANSSTARIVENDGPGKGLFQPPGLALQAPGETPYADQAGRSFSSSGSRRSKMEPHKKTATSPDSFAGEVVGHLLSHHRKAEFDRLIICAAPVMLAQIRDLLPDQIRSQIIGEISKDLTQVPVNKLPPYFDNLLAT